MTRKLDKTKLLQAMQIHGLVDEFKQRAQPHVNSAELFNWLRSLPQLSQVIWPRDIRDIRKKLGCGAAHGGKHGPHGKQFYRVTKRMKMVEA